MRRRIRHIGLVASLALLTGCADIDKQFTQATRTYYELTKNEAVDCIANKPGLTDEQKQDRLIFIAQFGKTLDEAEVSAGIREEGEGR